MFNVGQYVWTFHELRRKGDDMVIGRTVAKYRVLNTDGTMVALLRAGRSSTIESILDLFTIKFVKIEQCYVSEKAADEAKSMEEKAEAVIRKSNNC